MRILFFSARGDHRNHCFYTFWWQLHTFYIFFILFSYFFILFIFFPGESIKSGNSWISKTFWFDIFCGFPLLLVYVYDCFRFVFVSMHFFVVFVFVLLGCAVFAKQEKRSVRNKIKYLYISCFSQGTLSLLYESLNEKAFLFKE